MNARPFLTIARLLLALTVLFLAVGHCFAQSQKVPSTGPCTVNGKTYNICSPAMQKQAARQAARLKAAPLKKGVTVTFAGVSPATVTKSPLAPTTALGAGAMVSAMASFGAQPDYFALGNYANSPLPVITGGTISGGIRKFVNTLPGLCGVSTPDPVLNQCIPLATKETRVFPNDPVGGSDFYRIGLNEYTKQMHSDLPATPLRGYFDAVADPTGISHQYLGPLILATRNRPVRVLFTNQIATDLNIPVDTTYMGAGAISDGTNSTALSSQRRATLHLHGGNTPWISDGTTHQWITPANDPQNATLPFRGFAKGFSFQNVPDMVGTGNLIPTPSFTDGMATFYWTNQQSGRLMFYHDHAYGITRLNVYAGEAAGYLLVDPVQESGLLSATAPGTIVTDPATGGVLSADLAHVVPLVIQDKTYVPDPATQLAAQDPTWDIASGGGLGSLWFPHVYMPNQNPADITGANGFGRWDYGPWFFPPQDPSTFLGKPYTCTSAAYPGGAGLAFPPLVCPGTPLPSGTPESFMDTPVVNGTAYPTLQVAPAAYRFQVLNAANDRGLNLGLYLAEPVTLSPIITSPGSGYTNPVVTIGGCTGGTAFAQVGDGVDPATGLPFLSGIVGITIGTQPSACTSPTITIADTAPGTGAGAAASVVMSTNTDVHMVPAIPITAGRALPNCSQKAPMAGGGQVTALVDGSGNPLNGTGLPANCWPLYSSAQGYTAGPFGENGGQLSWGNSDARIGGIPDPTTAGPPIIQIGAEGGVLPKVAVIPSTPVSYDYNKRSITVLNVLNHGLWLGPAERADIIIDFSNPAFAGKTLILYNDAPAPIPAGDPRLDYYTNNPDQSASGGAPSTLAGFGPNMRTIMQISVTGSNPNTTPFSLPALAAALPNIFAATQDKVIMPEPDYPAANGNGPATYVPIQATSINAWIGGPVGTLTLTSGGAGYTAVPNVNITGGGGSGAQATATLGTAGVASVNLTNTGGFGYTTLPAVTLSGGGGTGASATAILGNGGVRSITVTAGGSGYLAAPKVLIAAPPVGGTQATATATVRTSGQRNVTSITVTNPGSG